MPAIPLVDAEMAAELFGRHLRDFWASGRPDKWGWTIEYRDPLTAIVHVTGRRQDGTVDPYLILLDGRSYDEYPAGVYFVRPEPFAARPGPGSRWLPTFGNVPFPFALHQTYAYPDQTTDQLVCFSQSRDYYLSGHNPTSGERWKPGEQTVSATLSRLREVLSPPCYQGPAGDLDT